MSGAPDEHQPESSRGCDGGDGGDGLPMEPFPQSRRVGVNVSAAPFAPGGDWLKVTGLYINIGKRLSDDLRASASPYTGWSGFNYDTGLPRERLKEMLLHLAENDIRAFLAQAHRDRTTLDSETLSRWLIEVEGWPEEQASGLADQFAFARDLLKAYDEDRE